MNIPVHTLLIDIGNSRIKWRHVDAAGWSADNAQGHATHAAASHLAEAWRVLAPAIDQVQIANVAGPAVLEQIVTMLPASVSPSAIEVLIPTRSQCGVHNIYPEPQRLGADRWAALIAAHALYPHTSCLIISLGTATTIDLLNADGQFAGGVILPGVDTMRRSLAQNTAQLPHAAVHVLGHFVSLADNTADAIESGILHAQLGAIERIWRHAQTQVAAPLVVLVSGGGAALVAPLLAFEPKIEDQLVLRGLYEVARNIS